MVVKLLLFCSLLCHRGHGFNLLFPIFTPISLYATQQRVNVGATAVARSRGRLKLANNDAKFTESTTKGKLSIAIVGSGAVGCYYGARLWETGQYDVKFYMRGEHYEVSKAKGLIVTSIEGDVYIPPDKLKAYDSTEKMAKVDWVIMALKSTGLDATPTLVLPLLKKETRILAIMNGLVDDDIVALLENTPSETELTANQNSANRTAFPSPKLTKCAAIYGGMALLCSNRIAPGHVDHSFAGKLTASLAASSMIGGGRGDDRDREAMEALFRPTKGFEFIYDDNAVRGRWTKNLWNLPFNGISVAMGGITVDKIVTDPGLRRLSDIVMDETIAVANADLEARGYDSTSFLGQLEKDQMMNLSDSMGPYKTSTMLDLLNRKPMEVKYLFRKAVDRANQLNVAVPRLETLVTQIEAFQRFYNL